MTEITTLFFSFMFCLAGVAVGFIFGWFGNEYYGSYLESQVMSNVHPELLTEDGYFINEELLSVRFLDEEEWEEEFEDE